MKLRGTIRTVTVAILGVVLLAWSAAAQSNGTFTGRVIDKDGGRIPGVTITVRNAETGVVRNSITNAEGVYSVPGLEPGTYAIKAALPGFADGLSDRVVLGVSATLTVDFTMSVAAVSENVTVSGSAPLIEVSRSEVKATIRTTEVANLPMITRNFNSLVALLPGAKPVAPYHPVKRNAGVVSFGGSVGRNVIATVDGADNRDNMVGGIAMNFTVESIEEFVLATHRFSAAESRSAGAALTLVSKSGTNTFAGSGFFFNRNKALITKDYFTARDGLAKQPFSRYQYGGSVGGPIVTNRAFFFVAAEGVNETTSVTVPDRQYQEMLLLAPFGAKPVHAIQQPFYDALYTIKSNVHLTDTHSFIARYAGQRNERKNGGLSQRTDLTTQMVEPNSYWNAVAQHSWIVSPRVLNQITMTVSHLDCLSDWYNPAGQLFLKNYPNADKLPIERSLAFPSVTIGSSGNGYQCAQDLRPQIRNDTTFQVGSHATKFGASYNYYTKQGVDNTLQHWGTLTFFDDPSVIISNSNGLYPQGFQTPGIVSRWAQGSNALAKAWIDGEQQFMTWFQDDWRVKPNLTLNLGVRYDLDINFYDQRKYSLNATGQVLRAIGNPYGEYPQMSTKNISPRAGLAYDIQGNGRRVLRGGYGLYFDQFGILGNVFAYFQNVRPLQVLATRVNTAVGVGDLASYRYGIDQLLQPDSSGQLPPNTAGYWFDPNISDPHNHQYNIGYSHQVAANTVVSADFTHIDGRNEDKTINLNPIVNGTRVLAPALQAVYGIPNLLSDIQITASINKSRYDELAVQLQQRIPRATLQVSYTLSGAYAYGGQITAGGAGATAQDQFNLFAPGEWGPTATDERHRVVAFGVFELPYGIQISPVFQAATARPYTLTAGRDLNRDGTANDRYVDPISGVQASVNGQRGDPLFLLDLRTTKFFAIGRGRRLGVFAEFFNLTNAANYGASYGGNAASRATFQQPIGFMPGLGYPFQVQFGGRLTF
jgi:hypothetical protein